MGLLDLFTGAASEKAAKNNAAAIAAGQQQAGTSLRDTSTAALTYLLGGPNGEQGALQKTEQGYGQARTDVSNQYGQTQGYLGKLGELYQPLTQGGQNAFNAYLDATGANGADGSARAATAFQASPGYNYSVDQALGAVQRSAAARGGLAGGNATADILKTATGLADQGYQQYLSNLGNAAQSYQTGLAGQAQGLGAQASASQGYGNTLAGIDTGQANAISGIFGQGAGIQSALGSNLAGMYTNSANALVQNNNNLAASQNAAGANILGAITGLVGLGSGSAGSSAGAAAAPGASNGGLLGALGSIFRSS